MAISFLNFVTEKKTKNKKKIRHDTLFRPSVGLLLKPLLWPNIRHKYITNDEAIQSLDNSAQNGHFYRFFLQKPTFFFNFLTENQKSTTIIFCRTVLPVVGRVQLIATLRLVKAGLLSNFPPGSQ